LSTAVFLNGAKYQSAPDRFEYLLTPMGNDLHSPYYDDGLGGPLARSGKASMLLKHEKCGKVFSPTLSAIAATSPVQAYTMKYRMRYDPKKFGGPKKRPGGARPRVDRSVYFLRAGICFRRADGRLRRGMVARSL
jgi:hypothetical protein